MKIGSSTDPFNAGPASGTRTAAKGTAGTEGSAAAKEVSLSDLSRKLSAMETGVSGGVVESARVSAIKAAIRNGEFKVNTEAVADRLLQSVHDMLGKKA
ncbi:MAG: flagellar biosynthesis anti-sigma factor FlgM [Betaproteobacteria bacterium]